MRKRKQTDLDDFLVDESKVVIRFFHPEVMRHDCLFVFCSDKVSIR